MTDAMTVRGLSARTIECYTEAIARLRRHCGGVDPAQLSLEKIEAYFVGPEPPEAPINTVVSG